MHKKALLRIRSFYPLCNYDIMTPVVTPNPTTERGCSSLSIVISFLVSVMAGIVSYNICKWLERNDSDN